MGTVSYLRYCQEPSPLPQQPRPCCMGSELRGASLTASGSAYRVDGKVCGSGSQSRRQHGQQLQAIQLSILVIVMESKEVEQDWGRKAGLEKAGTHRAAGTQPRLCPPRASQSLTLLPVHVLWVLFHLLQPLEVILQTSVEKAADPSGESRL